VSRPTALIADDEPLLREELARRLAAAWPELEIVAFARNGREAVRQFEALVRIALKELAAQLDPAQFAQVHRAIVVNLRAVSRVERGENETAEIHLKGRKEVLPVSRSYLHLFRQM